jgi:hypothetical protein
MVYVDGDDNLLIEKILAVIIEKKFPHLTFIIDVVNK